MLAVKLCDSRPGVGWLLQLPRTAQIVPDRPIQPDVQRMADERVADRYLVEVRERAEQREVVEIEIVAGIDAEAEAVGEPRGGGVLVEALLPDVAARRIRAGVGLGVELDPIGVE